MFISSRDACDARNGWHKWGPGNGTQVCFAGRQINRGICRAGLLQDGYSVCGVVGCILVRYKVKGGCLLWLDLRNLFYDK